MEYGEVAQAGGTAFGCEVPTFDSILDRTCECLMDRQAKYSIARIRELEERLCRMEAELDEFLNVGGFQPW